MLIAFGRQAKLAEIIQEIVESTYKRIHDQVSGINTVLDLEHRVAELRQQVDTLEIDKSKREEGFARREREIDHKVGLERKRQEVELAAAKRDAALTARETALEADKQRFEAQLKFHEDRFTAEVGYLKEIMASILERLPDMTVEVTRKEVIHNG